MNLARFVCTFWVSMIAVPGLAADCAPLDGREFETCMRANAKRERVDARSSAFLPSDLHSDLGALDSENPFATELYRVRFTSSGIPEVDDFLVRCAKLKATVVFARWYVDQTSAGTLGDLESFRSTLRELVQSVPREAIALKSEGQTLVMQLPQILAGPQLLRIPAVTTAVNDAVRDNLVPAISGAPSVGASLAANVL